MSQVAREIVSKKRREGPYRHSLAEVSSGFSRDSFPKQHCDESTPVAVNVLCIKWGRKYGSEYVNRLYHGVKEHLSLPFRFVCLTEDPRGIDSAVQTLPLPVTPFDETAFNQPRAWRKIGLYQPRLAGLEGDALFLDLDVVIMGPMDVFFTYAPGRYCVIHDWLERRRAWMPGRDGRVGNTSVFRFNSKRHSVVYTHFEKNADWALGTFRVEQQYVSHVLKREMVFWPDPWVVSFKRTCRPRFPLNLVREPYQPPGARILVFHGYPLPDQAIAGYKSSPWRSTLPASWLLPFWSDDTRTRAA